MMRTEEALAEENLLRRLEHECAAFRGSRGGAPFFPPDANCVRDEDDDDSVEPTWRLRDRMRTVSVALVLCLNIGIDPPKRISSEPRAVKECWIDPRAFSNKRKALERIGKALQNQYERWHHKARYRQVLDPSDEDFPKVCATMRKNAKSDRVLLHYNGHGVPNPTPDGEIWVFNQNFTQYIPMRITYIRQVLQGPTVYVLDCSGAGALLPHLASPLSPRSAASRVGDEHQPLGHPPQGGDSPMFRQRPPPGAAEQRDAQAARTNEDRRRQHQQSQKVYLNGGEHKHFTPQHVMPPPPPERNPMRDECIVLAPCGADETLPVDPRLPADLFTACLTTPISVALRWFVQKHPTSVGGRIPLDKVEKAVPGEETDRKSPKGELNWIFTAVTDSIAWNVLPAPLFQKLFRQDLLVATLFRNFLLAERVFKAHNCTPQTLPKLPPTAEHPLWDAWDLAVEQCLAQVARGARRPEMMPNTTSTQLRPAPAPTPPPPQVPDPGLSQQQQQQQQQQRDVGHHLRTPDTVAVQYPRAETPFRVTPTMESRGTPQPIPRVFSGDGQQASFLYGREFRGLRNLATLPPPPAYLLEPSRFFEEQMTAFEVWLRFGGARDALDTPPPQLPVVLQVMLSQAHRARALVLLRRFLELGPRAVNLALCVGFFPYVHKLVQTPQTPPLDLLKPLVAIWAAILAFDDTCKGDLARKEDHIHLVRHACNLALIRKRISRNRSNIGASLSPGNSSDDRSGGGGGDEPSSYDFDELEDQLLLSAFVLATIVRGGEASREAKATCLRQRFDRALVELLLRRHEQYPGEKRRARLRRWLCLCAANLCDRCREARIAARKSVPGNRAGGVTCLLNEMIDVMTNDPDPSARAAAVRAVATMFFDNADFGGDPAHLTEREQEHDAATMACVALTAGRDASGFVRREALLAIISFASVSGHRVGLRRARDGRRSTESEEKSRENASDCYAKVWDIVSMLAADPFEEVANVGKEVFRALSSQTEPAVEHYIDALVQTSSGVETWAKKRFSHEIRSQSIAQGLEACRMLMSRQGTDADAPWDNEYRSDEEGEVFHAAVDAEQAEDSAGFGAYLARDPLSRAGELRLYRRNRNRYTMREARALSEGVRRALAEDEPPDDGDDNLTAHRGGLSPQPTQSRRQDALSSLKFLPQARTLTHKSTNMTRHLRFHPHEPFLLAVDELDGLLLWDYEAGQLAARWCNSKSSSAVSGESPAVGGESKVQMKRGARISSIEWLDASQESILACGSDDGVVRIWSNFNLEERVDTEETVAAAVPDFGGLDTSLYGNGTPKPTTMKLFEEPKLLTAFVAADDLTEKTTTGIVSCWKQHEGLLYCGGDFRYIRAFDARAEMLSFSLPVEKASMTASATCICTSPSTSKLVFAGFSDGSIRMFDIRASATTYRRGGGVVGFEEPKTKSLSDYVVDVSCHEESDAREVIAACLDGSVTFWDVRHERGPLRSVRVQNSTMQAFAAHRNAPLLASGANDQFVKFMTRDAEQLNFVQFYDGNIFNKRRISPVTSIAFHDTRLLCAFGGSDSNVTLCTMQWDHGVGGSGDRTTGAHSANANIAAPSRKKYTRGSARFS